MQEFFSSNESRFRRFSDGLRATTVSGDSELLAAQIVDLIELVLSDVDTYDKTTSIGVKSSGKALLDAIGSPVSDGVLQRIHFMLARFARESTLRRRGFNSAEHAMFAYYHDRLGSHDQLMASLASTIVWEVPLAVAADAELRVVAAADQSEKRIRDFQSWMAPVETRIEAHKEALTKLETGFNFVGLASAFASLSTAKKKERSLTFVGAICLAFAAVVPPILYVLAGGESALAKAIAGDWTPTTAARLVAAVGIEVLLLYYFRVLLKHYLSVRDQITNLQLRHALCAFVEEYGEFASRSKSKESLARFEGLIFAPLPTETGALPPTIEGLESLAAIVAASKK